MHRPLNPSDPRPSRSAGHTTVAQRERAGRSHRRYACRDPRSGTRGRRGGLTSVVVNVISCSAREATARVSRSSYSGHLRARRPRLRRPPVEADRQRDRQSAQFIAADKPGAQVARDLRMSTSSLYPPRLAVIRALGSLLVGRPSNTAVPAWVCAAGTGSTVQTTSAGARSSVSGCWMTPLGISRTSGHHEPREHPTGPSRKCMS